MARYQKKGSTTATQSTLTISSTCEGCPKVNATPNSSSIGNTSGTDMLFSTIGQLSELQKEVKKLKEETQKTASFYRSSTKLNNTVRTVVIILMVVPVIQLLCCTCIVYALGIEEELPNLLKWVLSGVSILSVLELIVGGIKLYLYEKRMDELEKKIDELKANT